MKKNTMGMLQHILNWLKMEALAAGRYPRFTDYDKRNKSAACQCPLYKRKIQSVSALVDAMKELQNPSCVKKTHTS